MILMQLDTREFMAAFRAYMPQAKRGWADQMNREAFYISKAAAKLTYKADINRIRSELGEQRIAIATKVRILKKGGIKRGKEITQRTWAATESGAPSLALIIQARRAKAGKKGLYGSEMREAMNAVFLARLRAVAFMRSGWLMSVAKLAAAVGMPALTNTRRFSNRLGGAKPAKPAFSTTVEFWNSSFDQPEKTSPQGLRAAISYAEAGLRAALAQQTRRLWDQVARRSGQIAARFAGF